jgi:hypothetical protein
MPDADFSSWTPFSHITDKLMAWTTGAESVESGTIFRVTTEQSKTTFAPVV